MRKLSQLTDIWQLIQTFASLTKEVERAHSEITDLRRDVHSLTLLVRDIGSEVEKQKALSELTFKSNKQDMDHLKENLATKFEVLLTQLDLKISEFDKVHSQSVSKKKRRSLKTGIDAS